MGEEAERKILFCNLMVLQNLQNKAAHSRKIWETGIINRQLVDRKNGIDNTVCSYFKEVYYIWERWTLGRCVRIDVQFTRALFDFEQDKPLGLDGFPQQFLKVVGLLLKMI